MKNHHIRISVVLLLGILVVLLIGILDTAVRRSFENPDLIQLASLVLFVPLVIFEAVLAFLHRFEE